MNNTNEISKTNNSGFLAVKDFNLNNMVSQEMEGLNVSFERIKIPSGGTTMFEIPGDNPDEPENVKEFSAIILYHHPLYSYYKDKYTGGSNPPDCSSTDGMFGDGVPGGKCSECPYNQFGSGENGSKACKNRRRLYILREGEIFPMILSLPTSSLNDFSRYLMRQLSKGNKSNMIVTRFSLKKAVNNSGISYSQAQFSLERKLTPEEYTFISAMSEQVKEFKNNVSYEAEDNLSITVDPETGEVIGA